jgi:hypothetical protein
MGVMVEIDTAELVRLLVNADETNPAKWPPEARQGAAYLARIREIEALGREQHGEWD